MAWTSPAGHIFAVGEIVSAATLNTYVEANLAFLGGPYYCRAYQAVAQSFANGVGTTVHLDTVDFDPNSNFNATTWTYTAPVAGRYIVTCGLKFQSMTGVVDARLYINGSLKVLFGSFYGSAQYIGAGGSSVLKLSVGDAATLVALQTSGGSVNTQIDAAGVNNFLSIACLGPT